VTFLTVTLNAALDHILFIEEFIPGKTLRTGSYIDSLGGKGLAISHVQRTFNLDTLALAILGKANQNQLLELIRQADIPTEIVPVEGETRISHILVETAHRRHTHVVTAGYEVSEEDIEVFLTAYQRLLPQAGWVILAGSLPSGAPPDFYAYLCQMARELDKPVLIDCYGPPANAAVRANPTIMKMNRREMELTFGLPSETVDEILHSAGSIRAKFGLQNLIITCGDYGILALTSEGNWRAFSPRQVEVNGAGAGEAVSAMLPWRLSLGESWPMALRWGAAAGAATVLTRGTAECRPADVMRLLQETQAIPI
jgi:1-phosphofructokinase family hexose kinase